jgi:hypothetical protein
MSIFKKAAKFAVKNRKTLLLAATLIAPGAVAKAAGKVRKLKEPRAR